MSGSRKRRYEQIESDFKEDEYKELKRMKDKTDEKINNLMNELENFKELQKDHSNNIEKLSKLYELGIVNEEGEYIEKEKEIEKTEEMRF